MEIEELKKAALDGDAKSQFLLGRHHFAGHLIEQDFQQAKTWYEKAAQQNHAEALLNLGKLYEQGQSGTVDLARAIDCYQRAADLDEPEAQYMLSLHYELGQGLEHDSRKAFDWCRRAAEKNYAGAQYMLGSMYAAGQGVDADQVEARKWFRIAAENGYAAAQFAMGQLEETTLPEAADKWYQKAAEQGFPAAEYHLARLKLRSDRSAALPFYQGVALHLQELLDAGHITSVETEIETCLQAANEACSESKLEETAQWAKLANLISTQSSVSPPTLAPQLVAIGRQLQSSGFNEDAEQIFVVALTLLRDGSDAELCAELFGRLGQSYANRNDLTKAEHTLREALSSYETLSIENEQLAEVLLSLAVVQIKLEKQSTAVPLLRRCATLIEQYHGDRSSLLTQVLSILGASCVSTGYMLAEAEQVYQRVLSILELNGQGESGDAAAVLEILSSLMEHGGRPDEAEAMRERAAAIKTRH